MKLLPVALSIIALFLTGLLFLVIRRHSGKSSFIPIATLCLLTGVLFKLIGKAALVIALITTVIFFLNRRT